MNIQKDLPPYDELEPRAVWRFFKEIAAIPRASRREAAVRAHIRNWAERLGLETREDLAGNLLISVPATPGLERAAVTLLQGHLDMVCEKNSDTVHDFDTDPIRLVVDRDSAQGTREEQTLIVRAIGTTLGADNGIGVALALAAATSPGITHGPLEILLTVDEETGMTGALALRPEFLRGRRMLNLDSDQDDTLYIGCAGGRDTALFWDFPAVAPPSSQKLCRISVTGLRGGHSGGDIHYRRASAIRLLVRVLRGLPEGSFHLVRMNGGSKRNAIAREAEAVLVCADEIFDAALPAAQEVETETRRETEDDKCLVRASRLTSRADLTALGPADTATLLDGLAALPHGVLAVVPEIPGLVQSSNNLATIQTEQRPAEGKGAAGGDARAPRLHVTAGCLSRSSSMPDLDAVVRQIHAVGRLSRAQVESSGGYSGWQPNTASPLLAICVSTYKELFGTEPKVTAIHAGLECGIIGDQIGGMDMVSLGPCVPNAHSPDERVYVASVQKTWKYLGALLAAVCRSEASSTDGSVHFPQNS